MKITNYKNQAPKINSKNKNGGIDKIIDTTNQEREILSELEKLDKTLLGYRTKLRHGEILTKVCV